MSKIYDDKNVSEDLDPNSEEYKQRIKQGWTTWKKPGAKKSKKKDE